MDGLVDMVEGSEGYLCMRLWVGWLVVVWCDGLKEAGKRIGKDEGYSR